MLVLSRKQQEKIHIGDDITITVLKMKGNTIRLGIEAPDEVPVLRGELRFKMESNGGENVTQSNQDTAGESDPHSGTVSHSRISRETRTQLLPGLVGEVAPLRAMLNSRAATV